jgi:hypothetical protein
MSSFFTCYTGLLVQQIRRAKFLSSLADAINYTTANAILNYMVSFMLLYGRGK